MPSSELAAGSDGSACCAAGGGSAGCAAAGCLPNGFRRCFGSAGADRTVQLGSLLSQIFGRRLDAIENGSLPLPAPVA